MKIIGMHYCTATEYYKYIGKNLHNVKWQGYDVEIDSTVENTRQINWAVALPNNKYLNTCCKIIYYKYIGKNLHNRKWPSHSRKCAVEIDSIVFYKTNRYFEAEQ